MQRMAWMAALAACPVCTGMGWADVEKEGYAEARMIGYFEPDLGADVISYLRNGHSYRIDDWVEISASRFDGQTFRGIRVRKRSRDKTWSDWIVSPEAELRIVDDEGFGLCVWILCKDEKREIKLPLRVSSVTNR